jgi:hypothetical protein
VDNPENHSSDWWIIILAWIAAGCLVYLVYLKLRAYSGLYFNIHH